MKSVIVIGSGIAGLSSAALLAKNGFDVKVLEKKSTPGGKMSEYSHAGYRFDTGPSLITMPFVFHDFYKSLDENLSDHLEFERIEIGCKYHWKNGMVLNFYSDKGQLLDEIESVFGNTDRMGFLSYMEKAKSFYEASENDFLDREFKVSNYFNMKGLKNLLGFVNRNTLHDLNRKYFSSPELIQLFDRFATYNGSSPYMTPQFFALISYVEYEFEPWYVKGGIYKIAESLFTLCKKYGVEFKFNTECKSLVREEGKIKSIVTVDENIKADSFVFNTLNVRELLEDDYMSDRNDWSCSGFVILAGIRKNHSSLSHHNIFFSSDYEKEFKDIFELKIPADYMTIYLSISAKADKQDAPDGCENWFILVNAPALNTDFDWTDKNKRKYSEKIFNRLAEFGYDVRNEIEFLDFRTPEFFRDELNCEFGGLYGLSSNNLKNVLKRPRNRSKKYSNVVLTGGNTHPGGGVPLCILSGKIAFDIISSN